MHQQEVENLIASYKKHKCLWDFRSPEYKRSDMKKTAWQELASLYGSEVEDVKKKMKCLRSAYVAERRKVEHSYGSSLIYRPILFYYDSMKFLDSIIVCRKNSFFSKQDTSVAEDPISQFGEQPVESTFTENYVTIENTASPHSSSAPDKSSLKSKIKCHRLAPFYSKLNAAVNTLAEVSKAASVDSIYDAFGKTVALQLSQLSPLEATSTMSEIHQVLSKSIIASMLSKNGRLLSRNSKETRVKISDNISSDATSSEENINDLNEVSM